MIMKSLKVTVAIMGMVIVGLCITIGLLINGQSEEAVETSTEVDIYNVAILDAMVSEEFEIQPLVTLTKEDELTTWNENGEVLLVTWHSYPDSYIEGEVTTLSFGTVWTFTDKEVLAWYETNGDEVTDYDERFVQLIGLYPDDPNTHFTAFWVNPEDVVRPAYASDVTTDAMYITYYDGMDESHVEWMDGNTISSYFGEYRYPWTRLGYTYDWADNGVDYGLTEFLVLQDSEVTVEFTLTTEEFIEYMNTCIEE